MRDLTKVTLRRGQKYKCRLLFGNPIETHKAISESGEMETSLFFRPHETLGIQIWEANEYGTIRRQMYILRTVAPSHPLNRLPDVMPGAEVLLFASGQLAVQKVKRWLSQLVSSGRDLTALDPDYYRSAYSKMKVGLVPRDVDRPHGKVMRFLKNEKY